MRFKWNVEQIGDLCIINREDGLGSPQEAPRSRLQQQMAPHGVVDEICEDLCRQLDATGKAIVTAIEMSGKFFQVGLHSD